MRKMLFNVFWLIPLLFSGYVNSQYCTTGGPSSTADSNIESVTITGENGTSISYTGCPGVVGIENQLAQVVELSQGESYTLSVKFGTCGSNFGGAGAAWIDFNGDEVYDNATENVGESTGNPNAAPWNAPVLFNFTVPLAAELGTTRMRLVQREGGTLPLDPCVGFTWGSAVEFTVSVILPAPPAPEQDPTAPTCDLGSDLTMPGSPDPGVQWYWQTTSTGTSTANEVVGALTIFSNGIYYVRAYDPILDIWSPASSITISNFPLATPPPAPVAAENPACAPGTEISMVGTPDPNVTWYWQGTDELGTSDALDASTPFSVSSTGTYYVAAFDASTSCWSETTSISVVVSSDIPDAPDVPQDLFIYCSSAASMPISAAYPASGLATCSSTNSASGTDNSNVTAIVDDFSCVGAYPVESLSLDATIGAQCTNWYDYDIYVDGALIVAGQCNQTGFDLTPFWPFSEVSIVSNDTDAFGDFVTLTLTVNIQYQTVSDLAWYDAPTGGNFLGNGLTLEALGTSVIPVGATGSYNFYVASINGPCESTRELVTVELNDVNVELIPVDETCINYADGSFTLGTVSCGDAPFQYSIDGGAFDANIPNDLTGGTYSVVVMDNNGNESSSIEVVIGTTGTVIPANPEAGTSDYYACSGATSLVIGDIQTQGTAGLTTTQAGGNGCGGGAMFDLVATSGNITVSSIDLIPNTTGAQTVDVYTKSGTYAGFQTDAAAWTLLGSYPINGTAGQLENIDVADFTINQGDVTGVYLNFSAQYTTVAAGTNYTDGNLTIEVGSGLCSLFGGVNTPRGFNGTINYDVLIPSSSSPADVYWYDASTGGTLLGIGDDLESIGTGVINNPADAGTYEFYAYANLNGCFSEEGALVTVNVTNVNVSFTPTAATCNNGSSGSFIVSNVECGAVPFTFSVDGGAFGPIPSNLVPGSHTVVVMDANGDESAEYTIIVPDAAAPSDLIIVQEFTDGAEISWTAGALETEWNIEWGLPGFIPGTGAELGSDVSSTVTYTISGLDDNTTYDVYISANCGAGDTPGDWAGNTFVTLCGPIQGQFFCEDFSSTSMTQACWTVLNENGDLDEWNLDYAINPFAGDQVAMLNTDFNGGNNDDWLISPQLTLTGNEVLNFFYRVQSAGEPNDFQLLLSTTGKNPADFTDTLMFLASYNNTAYQDTTVDLSAFTGDVYIAWHVPPGGLDGWRLYIDQVCVDVCVPPSGIDGSIDACRLDELTNLNDIVVKGQEENGYWSFPSNEAFIVDDSLFNVELLPSGTYDILWVVVGGCTNDTTVASVTVFPPSSAGSDGSILACRNQPINLFDGLNGNIDLGGVWYNPSGNPITGALQTTSNIPGSFNYLYITSNGVCPADTALVEVIVDGSCDYLSLGEENFAELTVFPNPATDVLNIEASSNTGAMKIEMTDINGRIVLADASALANSESATISIAHLEKGVYTLRIFSIEGQRTFKIVKH